MIFNLMNGMMKTPILDSAYPADVSILNGESATFQVIITEDGMPAAYTYQWYVDGEAVIGETRASFTYTAPEDATNYTKSISCAIANSAGTVWSRGAALNVKSHIPEFTYTGSYEVVNDSDGASSETDVNWKVRLLTSGKLRFTDLRGAKDGIDVFLVGGGGGGSCGSWFDPSTGVDGRSGGGGGYTNTRRAVQVNKNTAYNIIVGAGGSGGTVNNPGGGTGGESSAFGVTAPGGGGGGNYIGGSGGSGGGTGNWSGSGVNSGMAGAGGSDGSDGGAGAGSGGKGQGTTTREFGETANTLYAGGGGGESTNRAAGGAGGGAAARATATANTGGGGGGSTLGNSSDAYAGGGGSGIVIIRNKR